MNDVAKSFMGKRPIQSVRQINGYEVFIDMVSDSILQLNSETSTC